MKRMATFLVFLLALSTVGLIAAEIVGAGLTAKLTLSALLLVSMVALVIALVSADRSSPVSPGADAEEAQTGPSALPWLSPGVRAVLDQVDEAVHITDTEMTVHYVNPAFSRVTGYSAREAIGRNAVELMRSGAHDEEFYEDLHETLKRGEVWSGRIRNRRASGEHFESEETISPIKGDAGSTESLVSIQRDLSANEEFERRFAQAKAIESFGLLAGGLAHDLNNFLIAIRTNVSFVQACVDEGSAGDSDSRDALRETLEAIDRASGLARKLLTMGKVSDRPPTPIDPNLVLEGLETTLQHAIGRGRNLSMALLPGGPRVLMEAVALEQIVINLVINSRDAMNEGGTIIVEGDALRKAAASEEEEKLFYRLRVRDNGPGIPEEIRDRVFEPFFTTKEDEGGTGLGLAAVRELVEIAHGSIVLECPPQGGTEVSILLPALDLYEEKALLDAALNEGA